MAKPIELCHIDDDDDDDDDDSKTLKQWFDKIVNCKNFSEVFSFQNPNEKLFIHRYNDNVSAANNQHFFKIFTVDEKNNISSYRCKVDDVRQSGNKTERRARRSSQIDQSVDIQENCASISTQKYKQIKTPESFNVQGLEKQLKTKSIDDWFQVSEGGARKKRQGKRKGVMRSKKLRRKATKRSQKKRARNLKKNGKGRV